MPVPFDCVSHAREHLQTKQLVRANLSKLKAHTLTSGLVRRDVHSVWRGGGGRGRRSADRRCPSRIKWLRITMAKSCQHLCGRCWITRADLWSDVSFTNCRKQQETLSWVMSREPRGVSLTRSTHQKHCGGARWQSNACSLYLSGVKKV